MTDYLKSREEAPIMAVVEAGGLALNEGHVLQWDDAESMEHDLRQFKPMGLISAVLVSTRRFDYLGDVAYAEVNEDDDGDFIVTPV